MQGQPFSGVVVGTRKPYDRAVSTICQECSWGCGLIAYVKDNLIVDVHGDPDHPANRRALCARGIAFLQTLTHPDRLQTVASRTRLQDRHEVGEDLGAAFDLLVNRLRSTRDRYGPESLRIECTSEAGLGFQLGAIQFATLWGTPHIFHDGSPAASLQAVITLPGVRLITDAWQEASALLLVETDPAQTQPVAFAHMLQAQSRGAKIIAADSRFTCTLSKADRAVIIKPASGNILGLAVLKVMLEENLCDSESIASNFQQVHEWQQSFAVLSLDDAACAVGIRSTEIVEIARLLAAHRPAIAITGSRTLSAPFFRVWSTLAVAAGWDRQGGGWHPLELQPPELIPPSSARRPDGAPSSDQTPDAENLKILICGGDCLVEDFSVLRTDASAPEFVAYFGAFPCPTAAASHLIFPAALWPEMEGICFSDGGWVQWCRGITRPPGLCTSGVEFWFALAQRLGLGERFVERQKADESVTLAFYRSMLQQHPLARHINVEALARGQLTDLPTILLPDSVAVKTIPQFAPSEIEMEQEGEGDDDYPLRFQLNTCSNLNGICRWSSWLRELESLRAVYVHPRLAKALDIENGDAVHVISANGSFGGQARITRMIPERMVGVPQSLGSQRVLLYKQGQKPEEARSRLREASQ